MSTSELQSGTRAKATSSDTPTMSASSVRNNLKVISDKVRLTYMEAPSQTRAIKPPRLVAVSKTKPKEMILEAYDAGHRDFGENYVQELADKSNDAEILKYCPDIKWHFIGNCQTKNVNKLAKCRNLAVIETITSEKLADKLQFQFSKKEKESLVNVMVQVNTSGEENKNGIEPGRDTLAAVKHIKEKCPNLKVTGLMTIGALGHSVASSSQQEDGPNPDFVTLIQCRREVANFLDVDENLLELSMGMSNDFTEAISMGSTNVRIGSSIFGARNYPNKPEPNKAVEKDELANDGEKGSDISTTAAKVASISLENK